jgi:hypothetical protein
MILVASMDIKTTTFTGLKPPLFSTRNTDKIFMFNEFNACIISKKMAFFLLTREE